MADVPANAQHFWQRWSADYLQGLQQRQRWLKPFHNLQPGGSRPVKGGPCITSALAHIRDHRYPSWQGQQISGGYY
jgi:hypothetical protein